jgi:hypothetical protein
MFGELYIIARTFCHGTPALLGLSSSMQEVIITASTSTSQQQQGSILFHDIQSGTSLASFKQSNPAKNCTSLIATRDGQGGLVLAVQPDKSLLHVYSFQKVLLLHIQEPPFVPSLTFPV